MNHSVYITLQLSFIMLFFLNHFIINLIKNFIVDREIPNLFINSQTITKLHVFCTYIMKILQNFTNIILI